MTVPITIATGQCGGQPGVDRTEFDCGTDEFNRYLRSTARHHLDKGMSRTFALIDNNIPTKIIGYYTLATCKNILKNCPVNISKKYPPKTPATKLARLAVSKNRQRQEFCPKFIIFN
jgi:hypothetical protein